MGEASRITAAISIAALFGSAWPATHTATLPVPCLGSACGNGKFGATGFVSAGQATATQAGSKLTVNQTSKNATLNWQSFNISPDGTVQFVQPGATSVALNQINDANATQIFGALNSNGRVFLINQNGIIFGAGAQVNVGGLVASTLNINPTAVTGGLIAPGSNGNAAFQAFTSGATGSVTISNGATLQTSAGGQILIFAPQISNEGTISTPGGQTMLAAGSTIYLATNSDPSMRGLLVEIGGTGGTVTNGVAGNSTVTSPEQLVGKIMADRGNITLAGLAVNQLGRVTATTSINENGSIRLQAGDHGTISATSAGLSGSPQDGTGGQLVLGVHSDTEVTLDSADHSTTVDSVPQLKSDIKMTGHVIQVLNNSVARATSGTIEVTAAQAPNESGSQNDGSSFYLAPGAELDVSGASIVLPVSSNVIPVQLRGSELANSPLQQNGPLRSQTVYVDIRTGTPLADVSGEIAAIGHNVVERNLTGGTIAVQVHGDAILAPNSLVDVAGGQIQYTAGYLNTTKLITTTGQIVDIGSANPNVLYTGIANTTTVSDPKWGVSNTYASTPQTYAPGYVEGKDAGTLSISAPQFVFDGAVNASVVAGLYQRLPDQSIPVGNLYRSYAQVPQAATLIIGSPGNAGSDFAAGNVTVAPTLVLPGLLNADGSAFNPLTDPLPASYTASVLRPELLGTQGFGNVSIYTNGKFSLPANTALQLPAGGSFGAYAGSIDIEGSIDVPGGHITGVAYGASPTTDFALTLGPQAALTARGEWVNDNPLLYPNGNSAPLVIDGGAISLTSFSGDSGASPGLRLVPGSLIDVSGGGQLTSSGKLNAGVGGSINLAAATLGGDTTSGVFAGAPPRLELGATLRGYGLYNGGSLALTSGGVCIAAADCTAGDPTVLWVSPAELASGGFSSYSLSADQGGLTVAAGTTVTLQQQNLVLPGRYQTLPDQGTLIGSASLALLPDQLRQPVSLALTQGEPVTRNLGTSNVLDVTASTPSLVVGEGALIQADPLANISLTSNVRILVDGTLRAPGGSISMDLASSLPEQIYNATQAIWLGSQGVLDVSGAAQIYLNGTGQRTGGVLNGGTVNLTASRGYIELLPGSLINVAGTSGVIDATRVGGGVVRPEQVASAGGAVQLTAAEGMALGGAFDAAPGIAGAGLAQPAGGSFSLTLDGSNRNDNAFQLGSASSFLGGPRQIIVSATQPPVVVGPGDAVPNSANGFAYVSADALATSEFDTVSLKAATLPALVTVTVGSNPQIEYLPGSVAFVGNVTLSAGRSITLDAATYTVSPGATANVRAPYIEFGNSEQTYNNVTAALASAGSGSLNLAGGFIELYGTSALEGIGTAQFSSTGDMRLRGFLDGSNATATSFNGALYLDGNLALTAQQIYPSTLTQFTISADPSSITSPTAGSIVVQGSAGTNTDLLSVGGALTLSAGTVTQNGVLRAPFGAINIDAQSISLSANSLTSTSADGLSIPFGTTQGGIEWVYPLPNGINVVYGTAGSAPPSQRVTLQGSRVNVHSGAVIDVSGGGDLQAYEWINGTGGTNDVLSNSGDPLVGGRPTQFAILPGLKANVAPYDPNISAGSTLQVGDAVYLSGMPGLPAGVYQLLPSRYALLPGAYLVTQVSGYQDIQSGQAFPLLGGGTIIAGYHTVVGTSFGDSRTSGFDVVPASVVLHQAQYTTTSADQFFASQATAAAVAVPRLPQDSGVLALIANNSLTLDGTLRTAAANGGLGAEVDISSADILVAPGSTATQPGQILLTPTSLNALNAQTLLLGGLNTADAITTAAQSVEVAGGASLTAPVVLLTALDQISVDSGASITATGTAPSARSYTLSGDGAFLSVSAGVQSSVARSGTTGATGLLTLAPGSSITANGGAVYLEASNNVVTGGTLSLAGSDLAVQSPNIILGTAPAGVTGTVLGSNVLAAQGLRNLLLESGSSIDIYDSVNASAKNIIIDGAGLSGFGAAGDVATLSAANTVTLSNLQGSAANGAGIGSGALAINATDINLGGGTLVVNGFGSLALNAKNSLTASRPANSGTASSNTAGSNTSPSSVTAGLTTSGSLTVTASQITTGANVNFALSATDAVSLLAPTHPAALTAASNLGGSLAVSGSSITVATPIEMPSGRVTLTTTGDASGGNLSLQSGGSINVAGVVQQYDGVTVASPGGSVILASAGNIDLAGGSTINVSAGSGGQGGSLIMSAPGGTVAFGGALKGTGGSGMGASVTVDAQGFGDFGALGQLLGSGGFTGGWTLRQRGQGDLVLAAGSTIAAKDVSLEADQGGITVNGLINAAGAQGGSVTLAAADNLIVNGTIDAHGTLAGQSGGTVQLETAQGEMLLNSGSSINVSGGGPGADGAGAGGTVLLRVPAATVTAVLNGGSGVAVKGSIVGSTRTTLEGFSVYQNTTGVISATDTAADPSNPMYADAVNFMANSGAIASALGQASNAAFVVAPGVEIDATTQSNGTGTLELDSPWNLYNWRFGANGNIPGVLTLRAQGGVTFNASLSDGFAATSGIGAFTLPTQPSDSWSYRIVGGADFAAANPMTVDTTNANPANVTIAACTRAACAIGTATSPKANYAPTMVRTGDGFIDVSASGNFVLGNQQSMLYTAGVAGSGITLPGRPGSLQGRAYPTGGGDIQIDVAHDVVGAPSNQFVNAWLWRVGAAANNPTGSATAWTVDFRSFQQGVAALAGGHVSVSAGGNISDLSVSIPTIGVQVGGTTLAQNSVLVDGGGDLSVAAGGSILGGSYYVGRGSANLRAGGDVAAGAGATGLAPIIGLGDAGVSITARGDVAVSEIVNPTLLNRGSFQGPIGSTGSIVYFSTYGSTSSVSLTAVGGNVVLDDNNANFESAVSSSFFGGVVPGSANSLATLDVLPPTLNAYALSGNVDILRNLTLSPAAGGNLQLFAGQNVISTAGVSGNAGQLIVSDVDPSQLPTPAAPQVSTVIYDDMVAALTQSTPDQHAATPVHLAEDQSGLAPVRIVALNGSVEFKPNVQSQAEGIWSAKPVHVVAGQDVVDLNLVAQNLGAGDVTSVSAGRDIIYPQLYGSSGKLLTDTNGIVVDGPGALQLSAGRNVDLGTSNGVITRANLVNSVLPATGASISVEAGIGGGAPQDAAFIGKYVDGSSQFDSEVVAFVQSIDGTSDLTAAQAKRQFDAMTPQLQRTFVEELFFELLRIYGSKEAASSNGDFSGAFAAISALFPGANPNLAKGETNPYDGIINLYFSRIYTQQGGNLSLLAPGGGIDVGKAVAPSGFGINKAPDQLGIVAQTTGNVDAFSYGDFQVNQSRVFAADGGDILVWSTEGNIDAGRGAKTAISAPALNIVYDSNGQPDVTLRAAIAGSGIQALSGTPGVSAGNVYLFAPHGVVNANDAGIVAGNLTVAATAVLGASNITVSGTAVGVPVTPPALGAAFAGASSTAGATSNVAESFNAGNASASTPVADAAISWLDVFVTGLGEENCKPDDLECLKRQSTSQRPQ